MTIALLVAAALPAHASGDAVKGAAVYAAQCAFCHGKDGGGDGEDAAKFATPPANLKAAVFKFRSTRSGSLPLDTDLERTIKRGLPGTAMVAMDHLKDDEVADVIAHLKTLSEKWKEGPGTPVKIEKPEDLDKYASQGLEWYQKAGCAQCHGTTGEGDGPAAATLTGPNGKPLKIANLTQRPFKGGDEAEDIYRALATGLDGTPMPSFLDAIDPPALWALSARVVKMAKKGAAPVVTEDEKLARELVKKQPGRK